MFPIRDTTPRTGTPYVVYAIILANALVFLREISLGLLAGGRGEEIISLFYTYGLVPIFYSDPKMAVEAFGHAPGIIDLALPFVTSVFLHGGIMHILGNMWMLWIFGDNVEDWMGHAGFAVFYLACGAVADLTHLLSDMASTMPTIGASGAIAGVMGAYFLLYPRAKVVTLVPIFFFIQFVELPAFVFLGFWFVLQIFSSTAGATASVAWWAHIGGFIFGAAVVFVLRGRAKGGAGGEGTAPKASSHSQKVDDYWR